MSGVAATRGGERGRRRGNAGGIRLVGPGPWIDPIATALEPLQGQFGVINPGVASLGPTEGSLGAVALAAGDTEAAIRLLTTAVERSRHAGLCPFLAVAEADLAEALAATDAATARAHAERARILAKEIGMNHVVAQVDALLSRHPASATIHDDG